MLTSNHLFAEAVVNQREAEAREWACASRVRAAVADAPQRSGLARYVVWPVLRFDRHPHVHLRCLAPWREMEHAAES